MIFQKFGWLVFGGFSARFSAAGFVHETAGHPRGGDCSGPWRFRDSHVSSHLGRESARRWIDG